MALWRHFWLFLCLFLLIVQQKLWGSDRRWWIEFYFENQPKFYEIRPFYQRGPYLVEQNFQKQNPQISFCNHLFLFDLLVAYDTIKPLLALSLRTDTF